MACVQCKLHQKGEFGQRNSRCAQHFFIPTCSLTASSPQLAVMEKVPCRFHVPAEVKQSHTTLHTLPGAQALPPGTTGCENRGCRWSWPCRVHSLCLSRQEHDAAELPSHTSSFHAPSCLQLVRNGFGDALNAQVLTTGA